MYSTLKSLITKKLIILAALFFVYPAIAASVNIQKTEDKIIIRSNGLPNHTTGQFPSAQNPHGISEQNYSFSVTRTPQLSGKITKISNRQYFGIVSNGVPFDAGTAEYYNRNHNSGWVEEGIIDGKRYLGIDQNNAHVQPNGAYHYHGIPTALMTDRLTHIGYAADGFKVYLDPRKKYKSSYRLKSGQRPGGYNAPSGKHTGKYTQDFEYVAEHGNLDECNGTYINDTYSYVLTVDFPFIPRCWKGTPDASFQKKMGGSSSRNSQGRSHHHHPPHMRHGNRPPPRY